MFPVKMDAPLTKFLFFLSLITIVIICSTGMSSISPVKHIQQQQQEEQIIRSHSSHRQLVSKTIDHELMNFPTTDSPTTQVTNPVTVTVPDTSSTPSSGIITVPAATPLTPTTPPPVTTSPVTTTPVLAPPVAAAANAPPAAAVAGQQSWCVAKSGASEKSLQAGLDYACGIGKADCSAIQQGASCYNPNALQNHASYAFNSYYQKNPMQSTSCDFGASAVITHVNPSSGSCIFPTSSSSSSSTASPVSTIPTPTPSTGSSSGALPIGLGSPPTMSNASNPDFGGANTGFGESPLAANTSVSSSSNLKPFISCAIVVTSLINGVMMLV